MCMCTHMFAFQSKVASIFHLLELVPGTTALPRPGKYVVSGRGAKRGKWTLYAEKKE